MRKLAPLAALLAALGCSSGPSAVQPPDIDAGDAASQAMEMYDKDGDGNIADSELDAAPELKASMQTLDANQDGAVQESEIAARIESWHSSGAGLTAFTCNVSLDGRPLGGATVTFEPAPFLKDHLKAAVGTTSAAGSTSPTIPKADRPNPDWPPGIQYGFFRIRISKEANGKETVPAKFNTETTIGQEVASDDPAIMRQKVVFDLKS